MNKKFFFCYFFLIAIILACSSVSAKLGISPGTIPPQGGFLELTNKASHIIEITLYNFADFELDVRLFTEGDLVDKLILNQTRIFMEPRTNLVVPIVVDFKNISLGEYRGYIVAEVTVGGGGMMAINQQVAAAYHIRSVKKLNIFEKAFYFLKNIFTIFFKWIADFAKSIYTNNKWLLVVLILLIIAGSIYAGKLLEKRKRKLRNRVEKLKQNIKHNIKKGSKSIKKHMDKMGLGNGSAAEKPVSKPAAKKSKKRTSKNKVKKHINIKKYTNLKQHTNPIQNIKNKHKK